MGNEFHIYVLHNRYSKIDQEYINDHKIFKNITILIGLMIDPHNQGIIDSQSVKASLIKLFPDSADTGILCIDLENKLYQNLKNFSANSIQYNEAVTAFTDLIKLIRRVRPQIKIGIYGLPFRTYYSSQLKWNIDQKLDPILSLTDYLFPSLYILYAQKANSKQNYIRKTNDYLLQNLNTAFDYAERLHKKVIPFVWYLANSNQGDFNYELLDKEEMKRYINFIRDYRSDNAQVSGVIWWETKTPFIKNKIKQLKKTGTTSDYSNIFHSYMDYLHYDE